MKTHTISAIVLLIIISGCIDNTNKALQKERITWNYNSWKQQFKDYTLCQCLLKGYGDKSITDKIHEADRSFSSPVNYAVFDSTVNSILKPVVIKIKADSTKSVGLIAENGTGKKVFNTCMSFYKSNTLNSITELESRKWEQIRSIDSLVAKRVPAY